MVAVAFKEITNNKGTTLRRKKQVLRFAQDDKSWKRPDHFFSQVFPLSGLLQISRLLVEITTSAGPRTSM